jgi:hypothetical protein
VLLNVWRKLNGRGSNNWKIDLGPSLQPPTSFLVTRKCPSRISLLDCADPQSFAPHIGQNIDAAGHATIDTAAGLLIQLSLVRGCHT